VSKFVVPSLENVEECGFGSYEIEFLAKGRRTFAHKGTKGGEFVLERAVWFSTIKVAVNGSESVGAVCAPRLRLFADSVPIRR
jgi:hypothetical protein